MKQYLMSVYYDGSEADGLPDMDSPEIQAQYKAVDEFNQDLQRSGAWVFGGGLHVPSVATVVRAEGGEVLTTDGPCGDSAHTRSGGVTPVASSHSVP